MKKEVKKLKAKINELVPSTMELGFGCKVRVFECDDDFFRIISGKPAFDIKIDSFYRVLDKDSTVTVSGVKKEEKITLKANHFIMDKDECTYEISEIIGHPINYAIILEALIKSGYQFEIYWDGGEIIAEIGHKKVQLEITKTLENMDSQTILFLQELICEE